MAKALNKKNLLALGPERLADLLLEVTKGRADMQRVPVGVGVDGYAGDPGIPAGAGDADSDFIAVGDEYLAHDGSLLGTSRV